MHRVNKNIWLFYFIVLIISTASFCFFAWQQWEAAYKKVEIEQTSSVKQFSSALTSLLASQKILIKVIEERLEHSTDTSGYQMFTSKAIQKYLDYIASSDPNIDLIALISSDGSVEMVSSNRQDTRFLNLTLSNSSRISFNNTLSSSEIIIGRTRYIGAENSIVIPIRKAVRDENGNILYVISLGLRFDSNSFFSDEHLYGEHENIRLIRDDSYPQFVSNPYLPVTDYSKKILTIEKEEVAKDLIAFYPFDSNEKSKPYLYNKLKDIDGFQTVVMRLEQYGLWVVSRVKSANIIEGLQTTMLIQGLTFILFQLLIATILRFIITDQKKKHRSLILEANYDDLTGLPNRRFLRKHFFSSSHVKKRGFTVLYIDIDQFKAVNDTSGHKTGDLVLQEVSKRLQSQVCESDLLTREAGDEFIILTGLVDDEGLVKLTTRIQTLLSSPFRVNSREFILGSSIGIAKFPEHGTNISTLLRSADIAMYEAKKTRNVTKFFEQAMLTQHMKRVEIEQKLRKACENGLFHMVYQPQLDAEDMLYGFEALIRWDDQAEGLIPPNEFIPIAEKCGQIDKIGLFVIETVLEEVSSIQRLLNTQFQISINISAHQFDQENFVYHLTEEIRKHNFNPAFLTIEITESVFINDLKHVIPILNELRSHGIRISLDDFGTGYSSLSMLRTLPIDELKIDQSFTYDIQKDPKSLRMVSNIIDIGKTLEIMVLAEGVEHLTQKQSLIQCGCELFQGYYFAKPMNLDDLTNYLRNKTTTLTDL